MTIDEMFNELEDKTRDTFIVTLKYKYDFEENYTIENHILEYDSLNDSYVWLNDWCEGQTDIEVLGYMLLGDVDTTKLEPCEDCISREEAIKQCGFGMTHLLIADCLRRLPSVEPHPKMGEWIAQDIHNCHTDYKCSECGYIHSFTHLFGEPTAYYTYCPVCGAKMEVEK